MPNELSYMYTHPSYSHLLLELFCPILPCVYLVAAKGLHLFDFEKAFDFLILTGWTCKSLNFFLSAALSITLRCPFLHFPVCWWMGGRLDGRTYGRTDARTHGQNPVLYKRIYIRYTHTYNYTICILYLVKCLSGCLAILIYTYV